jgi:hypothetical protein
MKNKSRRSTGFTVAELVVAMTISAVTLLSGYELFQALKTVGDIQSHDLAATAGIVHGLSRIREDLLHTLMRTGFSEPIFTGSNPSPESEQETTGLLSFYSLCTGHGNDCFRDLRQICHVNYELDTSDDSVCLYRCAVPVVGPEPASGEEDRELILDCVKQIKITFHNGQTSESSFSSNDKLPVGVELTVMASGQVWPLLVRLPCGNSEGQP